MEINLQINQEISISEETFDEIKSRAKNIKSAKEENTNKTTFSFKIFINN